jgi:ABC-type antimicrobial peptide transport system permease subunit
MLYGTVLAVVFSYFLSHNLLKRSKRSVSGYLLRKNNPNYVRNALLLLQLVIIILFISATGIVKLQQNSMRRDIFSNLTQNEREHILSFECYSSYSQLQGKHDILSQNILSSKHIFDVTRSRPDIICWKVRISDVFMTIEGVENQVAWNFGVAANFFDFFKGHIIQGGAFDSSVDYGAAVVNKSFLKSFPSESQTGQTFVYKLTGNKYRTSGVIDNIQLFKIESNDDDVEEIKNIMTDEAVFFGIINPDASNCIYYVKCNPGKVKEAKQDIVTCLSEFIPNASQVEFKTLQEKINDTFSSEKLIITFSAILFFISLILGLLNIYSSVLMSVEKRQKEIAIRKINGAELKDIIILLGKSYVILWTLACFISLPFIYYYASQWLERYKEPVSLSIPLFLMIYVIILIFISLTVLSQVVKTTKSNPAEVINND